MCERPIILLDLNYTLAANSQQVMKGSNYNVGVEQYRPWLRDVIADHHVILIMVRPQGYKQETLARIKAQLNWQPDEAYFNEWGYRAPQAKQTVLEQYVFPKHGRDAWYLAIESNDQTAAMYRDYGIERYRANDVQASPGVLVSKEQRMKPGRLL